MTKRHSKSRTKHLIGYSSAVALLYAFSPSLLAQEVANTTQESSAVVEEVLVTGVRRSLENALEVKRNASSIVDAISAEDIDSLPALDLGEALQAIPGIQLNTDAEGRTSEISLRGLPGNFVKTTAFGQSFANPTRSANAAGASNPFSAFEAGVFDGVTVIKAPTAEYQAGGITGIVDKKLQQALSKPDGRFAINLGTRFEQLNDNFDRTISMQGSKHLIEDRLAVAFKFAASDQNFRRDTLNTTTYVPLDDTTFAEKLDNPSQQASAQAQLDRHFPTVGEYRAEWNLPENAQLRAIGDLRNNSETGAGDRMSLTANIEFQVNDELKIGSHLLMTKRDLDEGTKEDTLFSAGFNTRRTARNQFNAQIIPDITSAPFLYDTEVNQETGEVVNIYGVSSAEIRNGAYNVTNRKTTFLEESKGLFLYADYETDAWAIDAKASYSEAENLFTNVGLSFRHTQDFRDPDPETGDAHPAATAATNINGFINTGQGNLDDIVGSFTGWEDYVYDNLNWGTPNLNSASVTAREFTDGNRANDGRRIQFFVDGRVDNPTRDFSAIETNLQREFDLDFDVFSLDSVKFGARISQEELNNRDQRVGAPGINTANISGAFLSDNLLSVQGDEFFGGQIPGTFGVNTGWQTLDSEFVNAQLQDGLLDLSEGDPAVQVVQPVGFNERVVNTSNTPFQQFFANNFSTEQTISAAYLMSSFSGDLGAVSYSGNVGVRYEKTENDFVGVSTFVDSDNNARLTNVPSQNEYDNLLPSFNLAVNLTEDVVVRTAYYEALVRPNIRATNPSLAVRQNNNAFNITLPTSDLNPYSAENFDLSIEWYNRSGSAISIGYFQKEITDLFSPVDRNVCPPQSEIDPDILQDVLDITGPFTRSVDAFGSETCVTDTLFPDENFTVVNPGDTDPGDTREVNFSISDNDDSELTVRGVEFAVQQNLDFLPAPWDGFGGVFNYTKLDQESSDPSQTDQLLRASPESYNIITYWEKNDISLRFSYNWRDDAVLRGTNSFLGVVDRVQKAQGRLDFSGSYKLSRKLKLSVRAFNLLDETRVEHFGFNDQATSRYTHDGRIYQVGLNYTF